MKTLNSLHHISRGLLLTCLVLVSFGVTAKTKETVEGNVSVNAKQFPYMPVNSNLAEVVVTAKRLPYMPVNSNLAGVVVTAKRLPYMPVKNNLAEVVVTAKRPVVLQTAGIFNLSTASYINTALLNTNEIIKELQVISLINNGNFFVTGIPAAKTLFDHAPVFHSIYRASSVSGGSTIY
jgi:hypothetical protein